MVVVEDPNELEEPYFIPGTKSFELAQRLDRAGFYKHYLARSPMIGKPQSHHVDTSYPGTYILVSVLPRYFNEKHHDDAHSWYSVLFSPSLRTRTMASACTH